ncbi:MAG: class I SAM-dependent methyltransferase [Anaerolineae bacterium]|nr:class I SAM-dependent methyltransferase [Anaerolineae bacterium]
MNPPTWDELYRTGESFWESPHPICQKLIDFAATNQKGNRTVLDLGCGNGRHLSLLASKWQHVTGLDNSRQGLLQARQVIQQDRDANVCLVLGDMVHLPFSNSSFDSLLSTHVIYHNPMALIRQAIAEIFRVLRPGGVAALTFQSVRSWRYGYGVPLEPNTFIPDAGLDAGVPHHYFDAVELMIELRNFTLWSLELEESRNTEGHRSSHWQVILEKP